MRCLFLGLFWRKIFPSKYFGGPHCETVLVLILGWIITKAFHRSLSNGKNPFASHVERPCAQCWFSEWNIFSPFFWSWIRIRVDESFQKCFVDESCFCHTFLLLSNIWLANVFFRKKSRTLKTICFELRNWSFGRKKWKMVFELRLRKRILEMGSFFFWHHLGLRSMPFCVVRSFSCQFCHLKFAFL